MPRRLRPALLAAALFVPLAQPSHAAPSFECRRAETEAEFTICGSQRLSLLDRVLADRYAALEGRSGGADLRAEQAAWLESRDACGHDVLCLEAAYDARLRDLGGG